MTSKERNRNAAALFLAAGALVIAAQSAPAMTILWGDVVDNGSTYVGNDFSLDIQGPNSSTELDSDVWINGLGSMAGDAGKAGEDFATASSEMHNRGFRLSSSARADGDPNYHGDVQGDGYAELVIGFQTVGDPASSQSSGSVPFAVSADWCGEQWATNLDWGVGLYDQDWNWLGSTWFDAKEIGQNKEPNFFVDLGLEAGHSYYMDLWGEATSRAQRGDGETSDPTFASLEVTLIDSGDTVPPPVPEPSALALLGAGLAAVGAGCRARRKK
jgi:hypothetical protein